MKTLDEILTPEFIKNEGGVIALKQKLEGLDVNSHPDNYTWENPLVNYLKQHFGDAEIYLAIGPAPEKRAVNRVLGARFSLPREDHVEITEGMKKVDGKGVSLWYKRLRDMYDDKISPEGTDWRLLNLKAFQDMTGFLRDHILAYLTLIKNQMKIPGTPIISKQIPYQKPHG